MSKKITLILCLLISSNLLGCCGCALVISSMGELTTAFKEGIETGDAEVAILYSKTVDNNITISLERMKQRLKELSNTLKIKQLNANCNNEINFEFKKANNIESVTKSMEIYTKSIEN